MARKIKEKYLNGATDTGVQEYEIRHREIARRAAAEGMVLLKNENHVLPLAAGTKVALYGSGATKTIKGGTGSGDVNEREVVSIYEGLKNAGYEIVNEDWIASYDKLYQKGKEAWRDEIWEKTKDADILQFFGIYCSTRFHIPVGDDPVKKDGDTALYILSRVAGEGADRFEEEGDYYLTKEEKKMLEEICSLYEKVIVVVNTGGLVDLSFLEEYKNIYGLIQMVQPGMEGGNALADVIRGAVVPSGKMTDSWAYKYGDYPSSATFSHNNGNVEHEKYEEGIYVGYRYFDSFSVPVRYCFGYGLSYTSFSITMEDVVIVDKNTKDPKVTVKVRVENTGNEYSGKEVVQIYASCPEVKLEKEFRRLVAYEKTKVLAPKETTDLVLTFPLYQLASYDEAAGGWVLEQGNYGIWLGNSIKDTNLSAMIQLDGDVLMVETKNICKLREEIKELTLDQTKRKERYQEWVKKGAEEKLPVVSISAKEIVTQQIDYENGGFALEKDVKEFVSKLSTEQLIQLATGDISKGQGSNLGSAGISVPGSAGETSACAKEEGLASIVLADGPAGLRLNRTYYVKDGKIIPTPFEESIENGFLCKDKEVPEGEARYQFCTAIPVGTLLAQTFDSKLVEEVGKAVAEEMRLFQVTLWLAPGMNIHRNPLCGRNFEYYSEDPLVSGSMAAAMTRGVQTECGCGTTIKHFACNNQEDNRMGSDSILSERTLREIYLKGFEIAVKSAKPLSIMTSYNRINGIHAANNRDLCTDVVRKEWGFAGVIMTDWMTTEQGDDCTAAGCMRAGNDLVMPGALSDHENLRKELEAGTLSRNDLEECVGHLVNIIFQSN